MSGHSILEKKYPMILFYNTAIERQQFNTTKTLVTKIGLQQQHQQH